jgi:hypothetical protein
MAMETAVLEGTWEEILAHADVLAGRRVRLTIVTSDEPYPGIPTDERTSTGASLLQFAGTWAGDDLQERLAEVYRTRTLADRMVEVLGQPGLGRDSASNWSEVEAACDPVLEK